METLLCLVKLWTEMRFLWIVGTQRVSRKWKSRLGDLRDKDPIWDRQTCSVTNYHFISTIILRINHQIGEVGGHIVWCRWVNQLFEIFLLRSCTISGEITSRHFWTIFCRVTHLITPLALGFIWTGTRIRRPIYVKSVVMAMLVRWNLWMPLVQFWERSGTSFVLAIRVAVAVRIGGRGLAVRVICSGYKRCSRLMLQPSKIALMADKEIVDFFKSQRGLVSTNGCCDFSKLITQSVEYI